MTDKADIQFERLLEASSLGTRGARRLRRRTDPDTLATAMAAVQSLEGESNSLGQILTLHPRTYNDARTVGEHFRHDRSVIFDLSEMVDADAKRLVDFAAGLTFGRRGVIERVTAKVFVLRPHVGPQPAGSASPEPLADRILALHPRTYNEARVVGEQFRAGAPIILNLSDMDDADAMRLVDFAAGLAFGLASTIERITAKVFLLARRSEVAYPRSTFAGSGMVDAWG